MGIGCPLGPTTPWVDWVCPYDVLHCIPVPIAQRLARYQEAEEEEEEVMPKVGTVSQHGSTGSHQNIRVTHKNQSIKCHRRTGSLAEAKRVSMLSKHTAFSSPMVSTGSVWPSWWDGSLLSRFVPTVHCLWSSKFSLFNCTNKLRLVRAPLAEALWPSPLFHCIFPKTLIPPLCHGVCCWVVARWAT